MAWVGAEAFFCAGGIFEPVVAGCAAGLAGAGAAGLAGAGAAGLVGVLPADFCGAVGLTTAGPVFCTGAGVGLGEFLTAGFWPGRGFSCFCPGVISGEFPAASWGLSVAGPELPGAWAESDPGAVGGLTALGRSSLPAFGAGASRPASGTMVPFTGTPFFDAGSFGTLVLPHMYSTLLDIRQADHLPNKSMTPTLPKGKISGRRAIHRTACSLSGGVLPSQRRIRGSKLSCGGKNVVKQAIRGPVSGPRIASFVAGARFELATSGL